MTGAEAPLHPQAAREAEEIREAVRTATEARAGGALSHSALGLDTIAHDEAEKVAPPAAVAGDPGAGAEASIAAAE